MSRAVICIVALTLIFGSGPASLTGQSVDNGEKFLLSITLEEGDYKKLHKPRTADLKCDNVQMEVNGTPVEVESLKTRGKTSLRQYRKSLTVELEEKVTLPLCTGEKRMKDFYLISMSLDPHYYYNRFAFDCLKACGIFPLGYRYVEVEINGSTEGVYLLIERPFDHILDVVNSPYALRRLRSGEIDKDKVGKDIPKRKINEYRARYLDLVDMVQSNEGQKAYESINEALDMSSYMRWLAFNYIVRNGDYTDEVYYYIKPGSDPGQFDIIPWDYDDIFMREPHEGEEAKRRVLGRKLLFSGEDPLDREIGKNQYVYNRYLDELEATLKILTPQFMDSTFTEIKRDLLPYLDDSDIVKAHTTDYYGGSDGKRMTEHMDKIYEYLVESHRVIGLRIEAARD